MKALLEAIADAREQLTDNHRLRCGVWFVVFLLGLYLLLVLDDARLGRAIDLQKRTSHLVALNELEPLDVWLQRLEIQQALIEKGSAGLWRAKTNGLAQAALQGSIEKLARDAGLTKVKVRVGTPVELQEGDGIKKVMLELRGGFVGEELFSFLRSLEDNRPLLNYERAVVNWGRARGSLKLNVYAYVQQGERR